MSGQIFFPSIVASASRIQTLRHAVRDIRFRTLPAPTTLSWCPRSANKTLFRSLKDLSKALTSFLSASPSLPLPDDITQVIEAYLNKHEEYSDSSSDRLQDDLLGLYEKHVKGTPSKYAVFIHIFRLLVPVLRTPARLFKWWDILNDPVLENFTREKGLMEESHNATLEVLMLGHVDNDDSTAEPTVNPFAQRLLSSWKDKYYKTQSGNDLTGESSERAIRQALLTYGKKRPKVSDASRMPPYHPVSNATPRTFSSPSTSRLFAASAEPALPNSCASSSRANRRIYIKSCKRPCSATCYDVCNKTPLQPSFQWQSPL